MILQSKDQKKKM